MTDLPSPNLPDLVTKALERAELHGFSYSCEPPTVQMLAVLATAVPRGGRILELGTGAGVSTAWLITGLGDRADVTVQTVESDSELAADVAAGLPTWVELLNEDALTLLPDLGEFDLIFADTLAGKWEGLDLTLDAIRPGGVLIVDDMDLDRYSEPPHRTAVTDVRTTLMTDARLTAVELPVGSGIIVAARRLQPS